MNPPLTSNLPFKQCREILDRQLNPNPAPKPAAWGGAAAPAAKAAAAVNFREMMMFEESAADLEGGDMDEDVSDLIEQQKKARVRARLGKGRPRQGGKCMRNVQRDIQRGGKCTIYI